MQRLGLILHVSPSHNIIVRVENIPRIGEAVFDKNLKSIGKVFDLFGPVSSPYAVVKPRSRLRNSREVASMTVYTSPPKKEKGEKSGCPIVKNYM